MTKARYSPEPLSLKLVCSGAPATRRSLFEANTTRNVLGARFVEGNCHWVKLVDLFERYQPAKSTVLVPELYSSIQSEYAPSSSFMVVLLTAMNSEMTTPAWALRISTRK